MNQNIMSPTRMSVKTSIKTAIIITSLLLLLIPLAMIRSLVSEREGRAREVSAEITQSAGGRLNMVASVLVLPYEIHRIGSDDRTIINRYQLKILPDSLLMDISLDVEYRFRGIYKVPIYTARLRAEGTFPAIDSSLFPPNAIPVTEGRKLIVGIQNMPGIREISPLLWNGAEIEFQPETQTFLFEHNDGGIGAGLEDLSVDFPPVDFSWDMVIGGGGTINLSPLGRNAELRVSGNWPSPSFSGSILPSERTLDDDSFSARWQIPEVSRAIPAAWDSRTDSEPDFSRHVLSVKLLEPVGTYARTERSVKYGLLFLLIPFVVFFLFELLGGAQIHPVQYLLAGCADVVFYLLLLALSEHIVFNMAYVLAASAVTALISLYSLQMVKKRSALAMPVVLGAAYTWLWVSLQSEDYALMIGSVGLFGIIALIMMMTRRVRWYGPKEADGEINQSL